MNLKLFGRAHPGSEYERIIGGSRLLSPRWGGIGQSSFNFPRRKTFNFKM
jgi:hypothetical protein